VIRETNAANKIFEFMLPVLVIWNSFNLGCTMDLSLIVKHIKKPKRVFVGLFSQFAFMPTIAFALTKMFNFNNAISIGALILGCAPGGGSSNWTAFMLDGDLELSIVMTFASSIAAMGMMPAWLAILASQYTDENLEIPYGRIGVGLSFVLVPTVFGIISQIKLPRLAKCFAAIIPVFGAFVVLVAFGTGIYVNFYLFYYPGEVFVCALLLPFFGFCCGYAIASILNFNYKVRITVCLETGIQNSVLATALAVISFKPPQSDDVVAIPLIAALMTASQTLAAVAIYRIWLRPRYGKLLGYRAASTSELLAEVDQERQAEQNGRTKSKPIQEEGRVGDQSLHLLGSSKDSSEPYGMETYPKADT